MTQIFDVHGHALGTVPAPVEVGTIVFCTMHGRRSTPVQNKTRTVSMAVGLMLLALLSFVFINGAGAEEVLVPSFGNGKIKVRLYTDYFCPQCQGLEPDLEPIIKDLVRRKVVQLIFIDTPGHKDSSLYARYFLYAMNEKKEFDRALAVRKRLTEAAKKGVADQNQLESFLKEKGIGLKVFDVKPTFNIYVNYLKADQVKETPACAIEKDGKTVKAFGQDEIIGALKGLQ
jgi:hypothetical protein